MKVHYLVNRDIIRTWPCRLRKLAEHGYTKDEISEKTLFIPVVKNGYIRKVYVIKPLKVDGLDDLDVIEISDQHKIHPWFWTVAMASTPYELKL